MKNKRFKVAAVTIGTIFVLPIVYNLIGITDTDLITAIIGALTAVAGVYLTGQSVSDGAREWNNN